MVTTLGGGSGGGMTIDDSDVIEPLLCCIEDPLVGGVGSPLLWLILGNILDK